MINVDCSLVQVFFDELNRFEWIYRGSRRIKEIYREENRTSGQRASRKGQVSSYKRNVRVTGLLTENFNITHSKLYFFKQPSIFTSLVINDESAIV